MTPFLPLRCTASNLFWHPHWGREARASGNDQEVYIETHKTKKNTMTTELKGIIEYDDDECRKIYLIYEEGKTDLVEEFKNFDGEEVQVSYWITDEPCTKDEMLEGWLSKVFGAVDAEYENWCGCSWTYGHGDFCTPESRGSLIIGGHDLFDELSGYNGSFVIIEITTKDEEPV